MNISLTKAAKKQKKKGGAGFKKNAAGAGGAGGSSKKTNVFGGGSEEEDADEEPAAASAMISGRQAVNRAIVKEQEAVRARVAAAVATSSEQQDGGLYDYDGAYDSFHPKPQHQDDAASPKEGEEKKSRYIGELLKAAQERQQERDVVYERKMVREQAAEEEADPAMRGKEKFVTAGYKRKLEERKLWEAAQEDQRRAEEENDVTKRKEGMANFYGNFQRNVAMGGGELSAALVIVRRKRMRKDVMLDKESAAPIPGFLDGFAKQADDNDDDNSKKEGREDAAAEQTESSVAKPPPTRNDKNPRDASAVADTVEDPEARRKRMRLLREEKVERARVRYFQRQAAKRAKQ